MPPRHCATAPPRLKRLNRAVGRSMRQRDPADDGAAQRVHEHHPIRAAPGERQRQAVLGRGNSRDARAGRFVQHQGEGFFLPRGGRAMEDHGDQHRGSHQDQYAHPDGQRFQRAHAIAHVRLPPTIAESPSPQMVRRVKTR